MPGPRRLTERLGPLLHQRQRHARGLGRGREMALWDMTGTREFVELVLVHDAETAIGGAE